MASHSSTPPGPVGPQEAEAASHVDREREDAPARDRTPAGPPATADAPPRSAPVAPETTSLERRVLAHERILQSLIAHLAETQPNVIDRLAKVFSEPLKLARREHDYTDTQDFAEEFMRAVVLIGEKPRRGDDGRPSAAPRERPRAQRAEPDDHGALGSSGSAHFQLRERSGVWEVSCDGRFYGDYARKEDAVQALAQAAQGGASYGPSATETAETDA